MQLAVNPIYLDGWVAGKERVIQSAWVYESKVGEVCEVFPTSLCYGVPEVGVGHNDLHAGLFPVAEIGNFCAAEAVIQTYPHNGVLHFAVIGIQLRARRNGFVWARGYEFADPFVVVLPAVVRTCQEVLAIPLAHATKRELCRAVCASIAGCDDLSIEASQHDRFSEQGHGHRTMAGGVGAFKLCQGTNRMPEVAKVRLILEERPVLLIHSKCLQCGRVCEAKITVWEAKYINWYTSL
ncbi:hypothetical protein CBM2594_U10040 [Cupriavidus taiwanensis]|uniref:Uncharacterized protein n=1 Tax=Cupriavidus taiwanensis TaxID=164546 RepID=A0A7Z7JFB2_9BURK|nr:hypothetical protein CBM2594_U10040 [Cupriavidus taiwanensis]